MDRISEERRSYNMSRVRSKNTGPEMAVRRLVYSLGYRYRLHDRSLPGKPDLVFKGGEEGDFCSRMFLASAHGNILLRLDPTPVKRRVLVHKTKRKPRSRP